MFSNYSADNLKLEILVLKTSKETEWPLNMSLHVILKHNFSDELNDLT